MSKLLIKKGEKMTIVIAGYEDNDIFFIADSAITSNNKTLLSGLKKYIQYLLISINLISTEPFTDIFLIKHMKEKPFWR